MVDITAFRSGEERHHISCCRAEELSAALPDASVDLIVTDPPYFRVKGEAWDRAWKSDEEFLVWLGGLMAQWRRVLKPNGSLYVFASPRMAWGVEGVVREHFEVLCNVRWAKPPHSTKAEMYQKGDLRAYFPASETIIFAEQCGADSTAIAVSGYAAERDRMRAHAFEPLRAYLDGERKRSRLTINTIREGMHLRTGSRYVFEKHSFARSQWELPTYEQYTAARNLFNSEGDPAGAPYMIREWDDLRTEYERLGASLSESEKLDLARSEYEDRRRPFTVSASVPYTDVWTYPTVTHYPGKHPCEKPRNMGAHIVQASSRPGAIVADFFSGSGVFLAAAAALGRRAIGCDMDERWAAVTRDRVTRSEAAGDVVSLRPRVKASTSTPARVASPPVAPTPSRPPRRSLGSTTIPLFPDL